MSKPIHKSITNAPDDRTPLADRYFLYIDILGFADLVMNAPDRVADLYEVISSLNAFRHDAFGTIVFSDTILVYPKFKRDGKIDQDEYFVMYLCEFAQDLMRRLRNKDIYFRAVLTQGKFTHYFLDEVPCFYGAALIDAYRSEKAIKALGLFMDRRCTSRSEVFRTAPFNDEYDFVYLWQSLEQFGPHGIYPFPCASASDFEDLDLQWSLAEEVLTLSNIARNRNSSDDDISLKHKATWKLLHDRYPIILDALEAAKFDPSVFCPRLDWTNSIKQAKS